MIAIRWLLLPLLLWSHVATGRAVYYAPSWDWDRIAAAHGVAIPVGYTPIATADCERLGAKGWLALRGRPALRVIVADCTAEEDRALVAARGIVAEVPYSVAASVPGFVADGWVSATLILEEDGLCVSAMSANWRKWREWWSWPSSYRIAAAGPPTSAAYRGRRATRPARPPCAWR